MTTARSFAVLVAAAGLLAGCTMIDSLTGQTDNTVLPGSREEAIPGRPSFPEKPEAAAGTSPQTAKTSQTAAAPGGTETYCSPDDPACKPPSTTGDTFKDPQ